MCISGNRPWKMQLSGQIQYLDKKVWRRKHNRAADVSLLTQITLYGTKQKQWLDNGSRISASPAGYSKVCQSSWSRQWINQGVCKGRQWWYCATSDVLRAPQKLQAVAVWRSCLYPLGSDTAVLKHIRMQSLSQGQYAWQHNKSLAAAT